MTVHFGEIFGKITTFTMQILVKITTLLGQILVKITTLFFLNPCKNLLGKMTALFLVKGNRYFSFSGKINDILPVKFCLI